MWSVKRKFHIDFLKINFFFLVIHCDHVINFFFIINQFNRSIENEESGPLMHRYSNKINHQEK